MSGQSMPYPWGESRLKHDRLNDRVTELVREAILLGRIRPGSKVAEREVAESLGVSRIPVRDALLRLEVEGLITTRSDGRYVILLQAEDIQQLYFVRRALETVAVRLALPRVTAASRATLHDMLSQLRTAYAQRDCETYSHWDVAMHQYLWQLAGNRYLMRTLRTLLGPIAMTVSASITPAQCWGERLGEHEALVAAIEQGDDETAVTCMEQHMDRAYARVVAGLKVS